jgi:pyruvate dehydrogenase E2 component (dihydrolipoamide acetyltransferase)
MCYGIKKHPKVNSVERMITINHHVNIGVAVAVEDGLVVPVLKFTDAMSLSQIGGSVRDLVGRAKTKTTTNRNGRKYFYCF